MRKPHSWLSLFSDLRFQSTCRCFESRLAILASLMADLRYIYIINMEILLTSLFLKAFIFECQPAQGEWFTPTSVMLR